MKRQNGGKLLVFVLSFVVLLSLTAGAAPREVTFWYDWGDSFELAKTLVSEFNASQDKVKVNIVFAQNVQQKLLTAVAGGTPPDIVVWDRFMTPTFARKGAFTPLDEFIKKDGFDLSNFYDAAVRELQVDGKTYGIPQQVDARALFYNKTLFEQAGISGPPTTWEELLETAKKLTVRRNGKLEVSGFALNDPGLFNMWMWSAGGDLFNEDFTEVTIATEPGFAVVDFWEKLLETGVYEWGFGSGLSQQNDPFITGKIAMKYDGPWILPSLKKYGPNLDFGVAPPVAGPAGIASVMGGHGLVIPRGSKDPEAAWEFVKWWTSAEVNARYCKATNNLPANKLAAEDPYFSTDPIFKPFLDTMPYARTRPATDKYYPAESKWVTHLIEFIQGKKDGRTALKEGQAEAQKVLKY